MFSVIALALATSLTVAATDSFTRIPGTRLALGMTESQLNDLGQFTTVRAADAEGASPRRGTVKFFGVPCTATLYFRGGVLQRAHFEAQQVAPHTLDYVEDQMRRAKLWRECVRLEPADRVCDWIGALKIKLEFHQDRLDARVEAAPRPWETEADSARDVMAAAPAAAKAPPPAAAPAKPPSSAAPTPAPPKIETAPPPTVKAPPAAPPTSKPSSTHSAGAAPSAPTPTTTLPAAVKAPPATPAAKTAPGVSPAAPAAVVPKRTVEPQAERPHDPVSAIKAEPVATLPETLRISLPERNPPSVWPRMSTIPALEYPAAARRDSLQGVVWVMTLVDADGSVRSAHIERGIPALNDAALAWASKAHFAPCERDGKPCRFWVRVAARFTLD